MRLKMSYIMISVVFALLAIAYEMHQTNWHLMNIYSAVDRGVMEIKYLPRR